MVIKIAATVQTVTRHRAHTNLIKIEALAIKRSNSSLFEWQKTGPFSQRTFSERKKNALDSTIYYPLIRAPRLSDHNRAVPDIREGALVLFWPLIARHETSTRLHSDTSRRTVGPRWFDTIRRLFSFWQFVFLMFQSVQQTEFCCKSSRIVKISTNAARMTTWPQSVEAVKARCKQTCIKYSTRFFAVIFWCFTFFGKSGGPIKRPHTCLKCKP